METLVVDRTKIEVNEEGYLKNPSQWTPDLAHEIAREANITLSDKHFKVLNWLRAKQAEGVALSIRKVGNSGIVDIKEFYQLFPGGPLKIASKIAGIPKPVSFI
jgi:tRNA 2-thiouridine synthesizing protein E